MKCDDTVILSPKSKYYGKLYSEASKIQKLPNNFNLKEEGLRINSVRYLALRSRRNKKLKSTDPHVTPTWTLDKSERGNGLKWSLRVPINIALRGSQLSRLSHHRPSSVVSWSSTGEYDLI